MNLKLIFLVFILLLLVKLTVSATTPAPPILPTPSPTFNFTLGSNETNHVPLQGLFNLAKLALSSNKTIKVVFNSTSRVHWEISKCEKSVLRRMETSASDILFFDSLWLEYLVKAGQNRCAEEFHLKLSSTESASGFLQFSVYGKLKWIHFVDKSEVVINQTTSKLTMTLPQQYKNGQNQSLFLASSSPTHFLVTFSKCMMNPLEVETSNHANFEFDSSMMFDLELLADLHCTSDLHERRFDVEVQAGTDLRNGVIAFQLADVSVFHWTTLSMLLKIGFALFLVVWLFASIWFLCRYCAKRNIAGRIMKHLFPSEGEQDEIPLVDQIELDELDEAIAVASCDVIVS